jgi:hypothetical protein
MKMLIRNLLISHPKDYYPHNYYNSLLSRYNEPTLYSNLLSDIKNKNKLVTNEEVLLIRNKPFYQTKTADVREKYGKSDYYVKSKYPISKEIFFYRLVLAKHRVNLELHFYNKELFFYNYSFPCLKTFDKHEIMRVIENKYLNGEKCNFRNYSGIHLIKIQEEK